MAVGPVEDGTVSTSNPPGKTGPTMPPMPPPEPARAGATDAGLSEGKQCVHWNELVPGKSGFWSLADPFLTGWFEQVASALWASISSSVTWGYNTLPGLLWGLYKVNDIRGVARGWAQSGRLQRTL